MKRTNRSIIEEFLSYGFEPSEIAEINGFNINTVNAVYKMAILRAEFKRDNHKRVWFDWERRPEHKHENDYGEQPLPTYKWNELEFEEKRLYLKDNHSDMLIKSKTRID